MAGKVRNEAGSSGSSNRGESVVIDAGRRTSSCGYCRSGSNTSISHGLWATSLTVDDYQDLLDRGWRRSGCFVYKPEMERTCCPQYTIRLRAADFEPSKEQLRVFRRMQKFLDGALDARKQEEVMDEAEGSKGQCSFTSDIISTSATRELSDGRYEEKNNTEHLILNLSELINNAACACIIKGEFPSDIQLPKASVKKISQGKKKLLAEGAEDLLYTSNVAFQVAAALRRAPSAENNVDHERFLKHSEKDRSFSLESSAKSIAEKLASSLTQLTETSGFSIRACNGHINFYAATKHTSLDGVQLIPPSEDSITKHGSKRCSLKNSLEIPQKRRRLEMRLKQSRFDQEEYALYRKYQIKVHNDTPDRVTEGSYKRFLVDTPLVFVRPTGDGRVPPCGFGSFHQQYIVDGQLVAVGVIDILPKCLSSKYLFWDPDFAYLSLGKYSALQEISWVKENQNHCSSLQYYYLGYYIHSCNKMRYKGAYHPSELLCPLRYQWVPFDVAKPLLDQKPYVILSDFAGSGNGETLPPPGSKYLIEPQSDDVVQEDCNDLPIDDEVIEPDAESSDDESDSEANVLIEADIGEVSNVLIGLKGSRLRYKDLSRAFGPTERSYLESHLLEYKKAVGAELAERMIYSLG